MALHRGHRQATAVSQRHPPAWRVAMSLFTTIPAGVEGRLDDAVAARAILWLPGIGLLLGAIAGGVVLAAGTLNANRARAAARGGARGRGARRAHRRLAP